MAKNGRTWLLVLELAVVVLVACIGANFVWVGVQNILGLVTSDATSLEWLRFFAGGVLLLLIFLLYKFLLYKWVQKRTEETAGASIPEQIEQLAKLKDQGILSEEEFEEKKKELLSKM